MFVAGGQGSMAITDFARRSGRLLLTTATSSTRTD